MDLGKEVAAHLKYMEVAFAQADMRVAFGLGAGLLEVLWGVHLRALEVVRAPGVNSDILRQALDSIWSWLMDGEEHDWPKLAEDCEKEATSDVLSQQESTSKSLLLYSTGAIADFASLRAGLNSVQVAYPVGRNLDMIEMLIDDVGAKIVPGEGQGLLAAELEFERSWADRLSIEPTSSQFSNFRAQARAFRLFGRYWFVS